MGQYAVLRWTGKATFRFLCLLRGKQSSYESRRIRKETERKDGGRVGSVAGKERENAHQKRSI